MSCLPFTNCFMMFLAHRCCIGHCPCFLFETFIFHNRNVPKTAWALSSHLTTLESTRLTSVKRVRTRRCHWWSSVDDKCRGMLHDCGFQCRILLISERSRACSNKIQLQNVGIPKFHTLTLWLWEQRTVCPMAWYCNKIKATGYKQIICLVVKTPTEYTWTYHYLKSSLLLTVSLYMFYSFSEDLCATLPAGHQTFAWPGNCDLDPLVPEKDKLQKRGSHHIPTMTITIMHVSIHHAHTHGHHVHFFPSFQQWRNIPRLQDEGWVECPTLSLEVFHTKILALKY